MRTEMYPTDSEPEGQKKVGMTVRLPEELLLSYIDSLSVFSMGNKIDIVVLQRGTRHTKRLDK